MLVLCLEVGCCWVGNKGNLKIFIQKERLNGKCELESERKGGGKLKESFPEVNVK